MRRGRASPACACPGRAWERLTNHSHESYMRWQQTEFIFKGIYLGLLLFVALVLPQREWWPGLAQVGICTFGTLALCLGVTALRKLREGYRIRGRLGAFVLFLLLENSGMVYAGVLLGMLLGATSLVAG